jgi:uncharacterized membrane protein
MTFSRRKPEHGPKTVEHVISEETIRNLVAFLVRIVEMAGALVIFVGATIALARFAYRLLRARRADAFVGIRLDLGRYLALGLEFQLAADLLRTAVAPSFEEIGKLAAVAAIRTGLNFFLAREIRRERAEIEAGEKHLA